MHVCQQSCPVSDMQAAAQQELQQAVHWERQTSEAAQRQVKLQLDQIQQQLTEAQRARNTAELEADSLRG